MRKNAYEETTIKATGKRLRHLERHSNLNIPEQVKGFIATKQCSNGHKESLTEAYNHYCNANGITWKKPQSPQGMKRRNKVEETKISRATQ